MYRKSKFYFFGILITGLLLLFSMTSAPATPATTETRSLIPCGNPIGVKIATDGVLVIGLSEFETAGTTENPSAEAKIKQGDIIRSVDGQPIRTMEDLRRSVQNSEGNPIQIGIVRGKKEMQMTVIPKKSNVDNSFYIGAWVRDSTAGIGTMTYYDPTTGEFGALGHPICDADTNSMVAIYRGEVLTASIAAVRQGKSGTPGELRGIFGEPIGPITGNRQNGIFGTASDTTHIPNHKPLPVAQIHEIKEGKAEILCSVHETEITAFDIDIEKVSPFPQKITHDMVIRITDADLIRKTGGIVQGMSGSPILQNGKIVGAVTHVFVNDPTRGYGIFIENMLPQEN